jgi:hypothetical protein
VVQNICFLRLGVLLIFSHFMVKQFCVVVVAVVVGAVRQFMKNWKGFGRQHSWTSYSVMVCGLY